MTLASNLVDELTNAARKAASDGQWHEWGLMARAAALIDEREGELNTAISLLRASAFHGPFNESVVAFLERFDESNRPKLKDSHLT